MAEKQEEVARERQLQAQQNKQQLALYHAALAAARAEAQAAVDAQAEEDALQVGTIYSVLLSHLQISGTRLLKCMLMLLAVACVKIWCTA